MKTPEEYIKQFDLINKGMDIHENFALGITRDCYKGTMKNIIKAVKQAQVDAYNQALKDYWNEEGGDETYHKLFKK